MWRGGDQWSRPVSAVGAWGAISVVLVATAGVCWGDGGQGRPANAGALVRQLGDPSFAVRKQAGEQLARMGIDAMAALEAGMQSEDREIRYRCRRLLQTVHEIDFERRLRAFAAGRDEDENYQLPAWTLFRKLAGEVAGARTLFVEMQRAESSLLKQLERSPRSIAEAVTARLGQLQRDAQRRREPLQMSLGTVASVLFVLNVQGQRQATPELRLAASDISQCFRQTSFSSAMSGGTHGRVLRKMFGNWIVHTQGLDAYYAMLLGLQYDVPAAIVPARGFLKNRVAAPNEPYFRYNALLVVAKFGDEQEIPLVEKYLDDKTPYGGTFNITGKVKYRPQIRDVALAAAIQLAKEDHKKFGFTRIAHSSVSVFNSSSLAFEDDEHREAAIAKWRKFRAAQQVPPAGTSDTPAAGGAG